jgi:fumarate reductase subunit D
MAHAQTGEETSEALWWSLFGAGGVVAALLTPAHVLLQNLLGAAGLPVATARYERARTLSANPLVRAYFFALTVLPLFHWAHRFRYVLIDLGVKGARRPIAALCYGTAIAGALGAAGTLLRLPGMEGGGRKSAPAPLHGLRPRGPAGPGAARLPSRRRGS